ncbi:alpha/beta hydrolase [Mesobacillus subterraneus]|uniref:alpha/beta hydrolase n=1 Tax=Mesobacillus subterraneus TaxID=285983 RepID=UPI002042022B|nr:alpha/beta hydrolase [Mesobacillus subterraneus]MCM3667245.1 alpha/beta hydrolase [Mesobacillus subterraneus]MCM3686178.1 alpha/beta hydrolase [Mesobacillus subterraneus]
MLKLFKLLKTIIVIIIVIIVVLVGAIFTYHQYQLSRESSLIQNKGTIVEFGQKKINVYTEGAGEDTFVFMPGSGIAAPVYEMKGLYSKFSRNHKIVVVEKAGYGYSDVFNDDRDIDTILEQTRKALAQSENKPPYILVPHSLSGLEAIYWAQKYPQEVKSIVAIDIGLPNGYAKHKFDFSDKVSIKAMNLLTKLGFQRLLPSATYDPQVIDQSFLSTKEKEIFKAISYKKAFNDDIEKELLESNTNAQKISLPLPKNTPILLLSAYSDQNENSIGIKQKNKDYKEFADNINKSEVKKVEGKHSLYLYAPDKIYQLATDFIYGNSK